MRIADISHYQGNIDWTKARKELAMVIFRASVGDNPDKRYLQYTAECGIPYGAYHYVKAGTAAEARKEASFFVECANKANKKPLFYIADIEYDAQTASTTESVCVAFLQTLRDLGCKKIGLYINTRYKWAKSAINMCDIIWIPHWGKNDGQIPSEQYEPQYYCDLWQYTSFGTVNGIAGRVDLNVLHGNKTLEWFLDEENKTMTEKFTGQHLADFCRKFAEANSPYWYACCLYKCTKSLYEKKKAQCPSHYTTDRAARYQKDVENNMIAADCVGLN